MQHILLTLSYNSKTNKKKITTKTYTSTRATVTVTKAKRRVFYCLVTTCCNCAFHKKKDTQTQTHSYVCTVLTTYTNISRSERREWFPIREFTTEKSLKSVLRVLSLIVILRIYLAFLRLSFLK